jgi:transmembrane sensor
VIRKESDRDLTIAARTWYVRMQCPADDLENPYTTLADQYHAFNAWIAESPEQHLRAYRDAGQYFQQLRAPSPAPSKPEFSFSRTQIRLQIERTRHMSGKPPTPRRSSTLERLSRVLTSVAQIARSRHAIAALLCGLLSMIWPGVGSLTLTDHYSARLATAQGGRTVHTLPDGTLLDLDAQTKLDVMFTSSERLIYIRAGQAYFQVHHDPHRPFRVIAGNLITEDLGTTFDVYRHDHSTQLTVFDGKVRAFRPRGMLPCQENQPQNVCSTAAPELSASQQINLNDDDPSPVVPQNLNSSELEAARAWREGQIAFTGTTLEGAAAEFERYNDVEFTIDSTLRANDVSGFFEARDIDTFIDAIELRYGASIHVTSRTSPTGHRVVVITRVPGDAAATHSLLRSQEGNGR